MNETSIENFIKEKGSLTYTFRGSSMNPLLKQGRDLITVNSISSSRKFRKYDVVLYRRKSGQLVLHRIINVREKDYVILGDNCIAKEYGICDSNIIGIMSSFVRNGKEISVTQTGYKLYSWIWVLIIHPVIIILKQVKHRIFRLCKYE